MTPLEEAAYQWWLTKRPILWGEEQHLHHPTIKCQPAEANLGRQVAAMVVQQRFQETRIFPPVL